MITAIIQARVGSTRLPNKIFYNLCGKPLIWHVYSRLLNSKFINQIVIATTKKKSDNKLYDWSIKNNIKIYRGSQNDVLNRYFKAASKFKASIIVRITADDPFKDSSLIDSVIKLLIDNNMDFTFNNNPPTFPEGLDVEVFNFESLKIANELCDNPYEREHVTQFFYKNSKKFKMLNYKSKINYSHLRLTLDTIEDYKLSSIIYNALFEKNNNFDLNDILKFYNKNSTLFDINKSVDRSDMYNKIGK